MITKKKSKKTILAALLMSMCLLVSFVPTTVFAAQSIDLPVRTIESESDIDYVFRPELSATFTPDNSVNVGEMGEYDGLRIDYYNAMHSEMGNPSEGYDMHAEYHVSIPLVDYEGETLSGTLTVPLPNGYDGSTARIENGASASGYTATSVSFPLTIDVVYGSASVYGIMIEYKEAKTVTQSTEITKGANGTWQKGSSDGLAFTSNAAFADFQKVQVDGKDLNNSNYTVKEGSTVVTLKADYLETLSPGKHTISIVSATGTATADFTVKANTSTVSAGTSDTASKNEDKKSPDTGNESAMIFAATGAGAMAFAVILISKKKKETA